MVRLTPSFPNRALGTENSSDRLSKASRTSQIQTSALRVLVALAALRANHSGTFTQASGAFFVLLAGIGITCAFITPSPAAGPAVLPIAPAPNSRFQCRE